MKPRDIDLITGVIFILLGAIGLHTANAEPKAAVRYIAKQPGVEVKAQPTTEQPAQAAVNNAVDRIGNAVTSHTFPAITDGRHAP